MMPLYINGMSCISPQSTFDGTFPFVLKHHEGSRLSCIEPDYSHYIDPKASRRMGRLLKYGTTAGLQALRDAGITKPDAISTGTGFGLLDDSGKFLKNVTEANEGVVSPTAFIQSTHNTVSSNIALSVACKGHNNTFVHKAFSLESALTDVQMLMSEDTNIQNALVGVYDELTDYSYAVMQRLHLIRDGSPSHHTLLTDPDRGTIAGEGAAFFVLDQSPGIHTYAKLLGNEIIYRPLSAEYLQERINTFINKCGKSLADIDVVVSGLCGDSKRDEMLHTLNKKYLSSPTIVGYKHLCGEYMTSSGFAMWLAAKIIYEQTIPPSAMLRDRGRAPGNILIVNAYKNDYAFMLLSLA